MTCICCSIQCTFDACVQLPLFLKKIRLTQAQCEIPTTMDSVTIFIRKVFFMSSYTKGVASAPPHSLILSIAAFANRSLKFLSRFMGSGKHSALLLSGIPACCCMPPPKCYAPFSLNANWKRLAPWNKTRHALTPAFLGFSYFFLLSVPSRFTVNVICKP